MNPKKLILISRPRFWLYVLGPFLIGVLAAANDLQSLLNNWVLVTAFAFYFLFPANLMIYGVNDIFDYETDKLNPKKKNYEAFVEKKDQPKLLKNIAIFNLPFLFLLFFINLEVVFWFVTFVFLSVFYSAKPVRAKSIPILDSLFNVLYVLPGFFGFYLAGGGGFSIAVFVATWFWCVAMHAYSAAVDIESDKEAKVVTTAALLGKKRTLILSLLLYLVSSFIAFEYVGFLAVIAGFVYSVLMLYSLFTNNLFRVYKLFPLVNNTLGFFLFLYISWGLI